MVGVAEWRCGGVVVWWWLGWVGVVGWVGWSNGVRVNVVSWAIYSGLQKEQLSVSGSECREDLSLRMACRGNGRGRPVGWLT